MVENIHGATCIFDAFYHTPIVGSMATPPGDLCSQMCLTCFSLLFTLGHCLDHSSWRRGFMTTLLPHLFWGLWEYFWSEKNYISAPCVLTQQKTQIVLPDNHVINLPPIWRLLSIIIQHYQSPSNMGDYPFWLTTLTNCACCGNFSHSLNGQLLLKHRKNCECCPVSQLIIR